VTLLLARRFHLAMLPPSFSQQRAAYSNSQAYTNGWSFSMFALVAVNGTNSGILYHNVH